MPIALLPLDLVRWDETPYDALVLPTFIEDRPLRGAAGLADWRLCGRLSRLVQRAKADGERGETLMLPPGHRLAFKRVMWFGLGSSKGYSEERFRQDAAWIHAVLGDAGARDYAIQAPGRALGVVGARRALELWIDVVPSAQRLDIGWIEDGAGQKDVSDLLRRNTPERR